MKNKVIIIILVLVIISLLGGGWIFKTKFLESGAEKLNQIKNEQVEKALDKTTLPDSVKKEIKAIAKEMDTKLVLEFLSDPESFVDGKTEGAQEFMKTPAGKKLKKMFKKYKKELMGSSKE